MRALVVRAVEKVQIQIVIAVGEVVEQRESGVELSRRDIDEMGVDAIVEPKRELIRWIILDDARDGLIVGIETAED